MADFDPKDPGDYAGNPKLACIGVILLVVWFLACLARMYFKS
jgi:hypothetical protein